MSDLIARAFGSFARSSVSVLSALAGLAAATPVILISSPATAVELKTLSQLKWEAPTSVPASAIEGAVVLRNDSGRTVSLAPKPFKSEGAAFELESRREPVRPGESVTLRFRGQISRAGKWGIEIPLDAFDTERKANLGRTLWSFIFL